MGIFFRTKFHFYLQVDSILTDLNKFNLILKFVVFIYITLLINLSWMNCGLIKFHSS